MRTKREAQEAVDEAIARSSRALKRERGRRGPSRPCRRRRVGRGATAPRLKPIVGSSGRHDSSLMPPLKTEFTASSVSGSARWRGARIWSQRQPTKGGKMIRNYFAEAPAGSCSGAVVVAQRREQPGPAAIQPTTQQKPRHPTVADSCRVRYREQDVPQGSECRRARRGARGLHPGRGTPTPRARHQTQRLVRGSRER